MYFMLLTKVSLSHPGTSCGIYRNENKSFLGYLGRDYINRPLQGLTSVPFTVPPPYRNSGKLLSSRVVNLKDEKYEIRWMGPDG